MIEGITTALDPEMKDKIMRIPGQSHRPWIEEVKGFYTLFGILGNLADIDPTIHILPQDSGTFLVRKSTGPGWNIFFRRHIGGTQDQDTFEKHLIRITFWGVIWVRCATTKTLKQAKTLVSLAQDWRGEMPTSNTLTGRLGILDQKTCPELARTISELFSAGLATLTPRQLTILQLRFGDPSPRLANSEISYPFPSLEEVARTWSHIQFNVGKVLERVGTPCRYKRHPKPCDCGNREGDRDPDTGSWIVSKYIEVAPFKSISRERIRQIEAKAFCKLRAFYRKEGTRREKSACQSK